MLCGSFLCSLCLCVLLAFFAAEAIPLSQDRTGLMSPDHPTFIARNEPRGAYQSSSNPTPRALSEPIMLYYFTCGPTVTLFAQGHSLKDVYQVLVHSHHGGAKTITLPLLRVTSNIELILEYYRIRTRYKQRADRAGREKFKKLEFEPFQPWSREAYPYLALVQNLIESNRSPTMKSNAMATLVTDKAAQPPALRYVSYKISTSADGAWAEMKNGKRGKGRMSID
ncbi:hypothetical protein EV359DRAFT_67049 [Lentinula novae-zelandiae]|nr:hypothetical protein EV359DRAFT_67049 [Lentinula novae-zelandiae]